ncbi:hypothetical protein HID58_077302 [Brassica napus]|uniref:(rape) hypothetical protein n=1 Tax=Brassica napus TaxID=3708 RepID=A0A816N397_BRANA|nr:uncharacterized protein BNAC07G29540D [Brassica napus]KAH0870280.1 hypothetical protein HID58_077302 [Brassica napus]CAF2014966.1 unnamed protein product [Brassica napus]
MVTSDDWTKSAMRDGEVVAELLVKLKKAKVRPVLFSCPTLRWGNRQPRSRKEVESARCSPSTPLSWSASSSPSAYLDGHEATIGSSPVGSRSKVLVTADLDFDVKRLQNKKDIALLSERGDIKNKNLKRMKLNTQISTSLSECNLVENEDGSFLLPDLNLMPCEEATLYDYKYCKVKDTHLNH